ncbi:hypothetical protein BofuT4_uP089240.1 [Botrytis cinerea T4]|uniref:Uncharacterized protein n=1 Tax=Botryotinia fuckeliana (strain T4) TaxID=999810 RepID=G2YFH7_BOTF4|nr:hypothetical protein BofuT4_uP089240.1 [Botrytis cinerea T4]
MHLFNIKHSSSSCRSTNKQFAGRGVLENDTGASWSVPDSYANVAYRTGPLATGEHLSKPF